MELTENTTAVTTEKDITDKTIEELYADTLTRGKYTFKLKRLHGKELFTLTNALQVSSLKLNGITDTTEQGSVLLTSFADNYDLIMNAIEFTIDGITYKPLYINKVCQCDAVETNVVLMQELCNFVYERIMAFIIISQRQLEDM